MNAALARPEQGSMARMPGGKGPIPEPGRSRGVVFLHEPSHALPLVDLQITLRVGACDDPLGQEGLMRLMGRCIRLGTAGMRAKQVEETIAGLGARLSFEIGAHFLRFHGTVIRRNFERFVALLAQLLREPAFRSADLALLKRETLADLQSSLDHDQALASYHFRRTLFQDHPYGRAVEGNARSLKRIQPKDLREAYERHLCKRKLLVAAAGAIDEDELLQVIERHFGDLPLGQAASAKVLAPKAPRGRHLLIVDKPKRSQCQLYIGSLGAKADDPDLFPFLVANTAFGGTFTSRLMQEVRVKRGWSYGAYSRLAYDRQRDAWSMWTFPAAKDVAACAALQLDLLEATLDKGLKRDEVLFARQFLVKSHCFDIDTAAKRLEGRVDVELLGLSAEHYSDYEAKIGSVSAAKANEAFRKRLRADDMLIVAVGTAKEIGKAMADLPGLTSQRVVAYDRE